MKVYTVRLRPEARQQANDLYIYIAGEAGPVIADRFVRSVFDKCATLATFPERGSPRPDLGEGLRSVTFRRRIQIIYLVADHEVEIAGIFYGGQDITAAFDRS